jgi:hypothetical protein
VRRLFPPSKPKAAADRAEAGGGSGTLTGGGWMVDVPTIRYVRNGDVALAYQVLGDGPIDLMFLPSFLNTTAT